MPYLEAVAVSTHADNVLGVAGRNGERGSRLLRLAVEADPQATVRLNDHVAVGLVDSQARVVGVVGRQCDLLVPDLQHEMFIAISTNK